MNKVETILKERGKLLCNTARYTLITDEEDMAHECNAYFKIKNFMANRIMELEEEVEDLKNELNLQVMKNIQLNEWFKTLNNSLNELKIYSVNTGQELMENGNELIPSPLKRKNSGCFNLSSEFIDSVLMVEANEENNKNCECSPFIKLKDEATPKLPKRKDSSVFDKIAENEQKLINEIKNQNIDLSNQLETLKNELYSKNIKINKLNTDKVIILNELNELLTSLRRVDIKILNKFFKENSSKNLRIKEIPSVLGIKYNILSAHSLLSTMLCKKNNLGSVNFNTPSLKCDENHFISLEKYQDIFKSYEEEFNKLLNKNLKKKRLVRK